MKNQLITALALIASMMAAAHEAVTLGPDGGRVLYVDSPATPNVEVLVNPEGRAEIVRIARIRTMLKELKTLYPAEVANATLKE